MSTGEDEKALKEILDFTRLASIIVLLIHFYFFCFETFKTWHLTTQISNRLLKNLSRSGLFKNIYYSKLLAIALLTISLFGASGKKSETVSKQSILFYLLFGFLFFFGGNILLKLTTSIESVATIYMTVTSIGFILILTGGTRLSRYIQLQFHKDIFN
jgi:hypothetical protein